MAYLYNKIALENLLIYNDSNISVEVFFYDEETKREYKFNYIYFKLLFW